MNRHKELSGQIYMEGSISPCSVPDSTEVPGADHVYSAILSSSRPVPVHLGMKTVMLVLDHSPEAVDMERIMKRAPILVNHDPDRIAGHIVDAQLSSSQLFIDFKLSANDLGRNEALLIREGTRSKMSVGAEIKEPLEIDDVDSDKPRVVVKKWQPLEASLASIPRNIDASIIQNIEGRLDIRDTTEENKMPAEKESIGADQSDELVINHAREDTRLREITRIRNITALASQHDAEEDGREYVANGRTVDDFRALLLDRLADDPSHPEVRRVTPEDADIGLSTRERNHFSWGRAIRAISFPDEKVHQEAAAFEFECSRAAQAKMGVTSGGILIPNDVISMTGGATQPNEGLEWVETEKMGFIENLRNRSVLMGLNPTLLTGLVGNVSLRTKTGSSVAYWTAEGGSSTASPIPSDQIPLQPHRLTVETAYDKQLIVQTSPNVDAVYRRDMVRSAALEWDRAALYGSGAANQPTGIVNQAGVTKGPDYTAPGPTFDEIIALETQLASDNADIGDLAYVMAAGGRGHLKSTPKFASAGDSTIWEPGNEVNGYRTAVSNQVTATHYWFGNWADLILAQWGAIDLTANPYIRTAYNEIVLYLMMYVDVGIRHPESFTYIDQAP